MSRNLRVGQEGSQHRVGAQTIVNRGLAASQLLANAQAANLINEQQSRNRDHKYLSAGGTPLGMVGQTGHLVHPSARPLSRSQNLNKHFHQHVHKDGALVPAGFLPAAVK